MKRQRTEEVIGRAYAFLLIVWTELKHEPNKLEAYKNLDIDKFHLIAHFGKCKRTLYKKIIFGKKVPTWDDAIWLRNEIELRRLSQDKERNEEIEQARRQIQEGYATLKKHNAQAQLNLFDNQ